MELRVGLFIYIKDVILDESLELFLNVFCIFDLLFDGWGRFFELT